MADRHAAALSDLAALAALDDPTRRLLYECVAAAARPLSRDEAAAATGIGRSLAAYHLDKLAEHGLLEAGYARAPGRTGPGAGRPAKRYSRAPREFVARTPPRDYRLLAELLVDAASDETVLDAVQESARVAGERIGAKARSAGAGLDEILAQRGYEPEHTPESPLRLRNCPFADLARRCPDVVCTINLALLQGIVDGAGVPARAELRPDDDACCVVVDGIHEDSPAPR
jgi:predicted ArsR family transcriptional regulator